MFKLSGQTCCKLIHCNYFSLNFNGLCQKVLYESSFNITGFVDFAL